MRAYLIILYIVLAILLPAESLAAGQEPAYGQLESLCEDARSLSQYPQMEHYSQLLMEGAQKRSDQRSEAYAYFYNGLAKLFMGHAETAIDALDKAEQLSASIGQDSVLALTLNTRAIYYATVQNNNFLAQEYFFRSLQSAQKAGYMDLQYRVRGNLLTLTHSTGGAILLENAQEVYDYGVKTHNHEQISMGSYYLATYYFEHEDYAQTEHYVQIALDSFRDFPTEDIAAVYCLAAKMYLAKGEMENAEDMANKGLDLAQQYQQSSIIVDANITCAELLNYKQQYQQSIDLLKATLEQIDDTGLSSKYVACNQLMASNLLAMGKAAEAAEYLQRANDVLRNQATINMERLHYEQQILLDMEQKKLEARHRHEQLQAQRRTMILLYVALGVTVLFLFFVIISYRRRQFLYRKIVLQNARAVAHQKVLEKRLATLMREAATPVAPEPSPAEESELVKAAEKENHVLGEDKMEDLYSRLCFLMDTERLYTEPQLTREKMAERLGTNRTYLTAVIKEKAGMSYLQFVNSYRINESIKILSDKEKINYPLKRIWSDLGFSSPSTFFKLFQQTVGITPSVYRKQFLEVNEDCIDDGEE